MKYFLWVIFAIAVLPVGAAERSNDFWDKCPGPACPANSLEKIEAIRAEAYGQREYEQREREQSSRERQISDKEKELAEKEYILQKKER